MPQSPDNPMNGTPRSSVQSVLFACSENAVRSPIAEAIARRLIGHSTHLISAGVRRGDANPFTLETLAEIGIDLSRHRPRTFEDLEESSFDLIITLSPEAHHRALEFTRTMAVEVIYWPTFDPTAVEGSRSAVSSAFRLVRDTLAKRIDLCFGGMVAAPS
ncbi:low molecular weight phosphatase family protein [Lichenihabitans psoromatis]|uniref:arsenate-mycothiol transferase ArsC n=1 Tax=Lichenihabitans psoromatis TaxID=2528642 RepID=UPI001FE00449|nr:low molecular weight phosphatase family protein [Lichenihabitans psoromatis]